MDRLFLDANILFLAAYRENAGLRTFWELEDVILITSDYAYHEAFINLETNIQRERLDRLIKSGMEILQKCSAAVLPPGINLPLKDQPILQAAIAAKSTHLITGDFRDFGRLMGKLINGVLISSPAEYLRK